MVGMSLKGGKEGLTLLMATQIECGEPAITDGKLFGG